MADKIKCNTGTLRDDKNEISSELKSIQKSFDTLNSYLKKLNNMWDGQASAEFMKNAAMDIRKLENACSELTGITGIENTAIAKYNTAENKISNMISAIKI